MIRSAISSPISRVARSPHGGATTLAQRIRALFAAGEQGVWYEPADFSTLFQDSAGTTPVTAVGQPVGLVLDKSKGLVLGAELVVNGDFSNGTTGWTVAGGAPTATIAVVSGELEVTGNGGSYPSAKSPSFATEVGKSYVVSGYARRGTVVGGVSVGLITGAYFVLTQATSATKLSLVFTAVATSTNILLQISSATGSGTAYFDNISVRELPGSPGKQATSTARPLRQASPTRIDYDGVDDTLVSTFASSLGAACTVCRAVPGAGASILTAQTIGTSYTDSTDHSGLIIVNRALTAAETASVTAYLNAKAFA